MQPTFPVTAVVATKQGRIVESFRKAGAISTMNAVTPASIGIHGGPAFHKLRKHEVLREVATGLYYLDEPTWNALRRARRRAILVLSVFVAACMLAWYFAR